MDELVVTLGLAARCYQLRCESEHLQYIATEPLCIDTSDDHIGTVQF